MGVALLVCACGSVNNSKDAGLPDAQPAPDARPNGFDAAPPSPAREILTGGGRVTGPTYTFDVTIGHGFEQKPMKGPITTAEGNTAIKP